MFTIEVQSSDSSESHVFDKEKVVIGSGDVDLSLPGEQVKAHHLEIKWVEEKALLINCANDPFTTLNHLPFGKKQLHDGDTIQLDSYTLIFKKGIQQEEKNLNMETATPPLPIETIPSKTKLWNLKRILILTFAACIFSSLLIMGLYFKESSRSSQEEKKIGAGVADIAMAIINAQFHQKTPENENWMNPHFLNLSFNQITPPDMHTQANINNDGKFTDFPYRLRVYVSSNNGHFIVIAQPYPHLLQWLIPKRTIVVDSKEMVLRKISDVAPLNRLLSESSPLNGENGEMISGLIQKSPIFSLKSLKGRKNRWGFTPPPALAKTRLNAENRLYNAPRYFPFGGRILRHAIKLSDSTPTKDSVALFQEEVKFLKNFQDIILYSVEGEDVAKNGYESLSIFAPNHPFMVGVLSLSLQGAIYESSLLYIPPPSTSSTEDELAFEENFLTRNEISDPLYLQLNSIKTGRTQALKHLKDEMVALISVHVNEIQPGFIPQLNELTRKFQQIDQFYQEKVVHDLARLKEKHQDRSWEEFLEIVESTGLHRPFTWVIGSDGMTKTKEESLIVEQKIEEILLADTFDALYQQVIEVNNDLTIERLHSPDQIRQLQLQMRTATLSRLKAMILDPQEEGEFPHSISLEQLEEILSLIWVTQPDERDYFIEQYQREYEPQQNQKDP